MAYYMGSMSLGSGASAVRRGFLHGKMNLEDVVRFDLADGSLHVDNEESSRKNSNDHGDDNGVDLGSALLVTFDALLSFSRFLTSEQVLDNANKTCTLPGRTYLV